MGVVVKREITVERAVWQKNFNEFTAGVRATDPSNNELVELLGRPNFREIEIYLMQTRSDLGEIIVESIFEVGEEQISVMKKKAEILDLLIKKNRVLWHQLLCLNRYPS